MTDFESHVGSWGKYTPKSSFDLSESNGDYEELEVLFAEIESTPVTMDEIPDTIIEDEELTIQCINQS